MAKSASSLGKTPEKFPGVPSKITIDFAREWVRPRVSKARFDHIEGVAEVACEIAIGLKVNPFPCELAAWLHDSCKEVKSKKLVELARADGMKLTEYELAFGHILHGPVAAITVRDELGITNEDVLRAIAEHTIGSTTMRVTSKIVYLADKLEASRPAELTDPIWAALNAIPVDGPRNACHDFKKSRLTDLDEAILVSLTLISKNLLKKGKPIQPKAMKVRNHFLALTGRTKS